MVKRYKWTVLISEWTKEEHAEYGRFLRLKEIWHQSGAWRRFSFEDFVMGAAKIIQKVDNIPSGNRAGCHT